jgi:hypothetical protein
VLSPSGRFAAWTCLPVFDTLDVFKDPGALNVTEVVRVSAGGMQRFQGVSMFPAAIDDDGDLLLYSQPILLTNAAGAGPRNLYVLATDGELARIDSLEPDPEPVVDLSRKGSRWIVAQPL